MIYMPRTSQLMRGVSPPGLRSRSKEVKAGLQKGQQLSEQKPHRKWLGAARSQSRAH